MMNINIVCVGKLKEDYLRMACAEYEKRLGAFCRLKITELTPARLPEEPNPAQISAALAEEGKRILACVKPGEAVFTLCIEGKELPSEGLAKEIEKCALGGFGSIPGALFAALLIGLVESFTGFYVAAVLKYVAVFAIYLIVILVRPKGLFGW